MNEKKEKAILFLINGLGVASKDSFSINYGELMPNLSMLMNNYFYTTLENINYNYNNGFRNFSLGHDLLPTYKKLEEDTEFANNQTIINIAADAIHNRSKVHLFCFLDNDKVINQVVKIISVLRPKGNFYIYIHIVLRQKDCIEYDNVIKRIKSLEDKITLYQNTTIGTIVGERKFINDEYYSLITKGMGEKWPDYNRKLNYTKAEETLPRDVDPFYMNTGFQLAVNDIALFLNYEDVDCNAFIDKITNVKLYTLFPMKDYSYAVNIYEEIKPTMYFSKTLEENNLKCLVLTTEGRKPSINYYLNGLSDLTSPNITYMNIKEVADVVSVINDQYDYIIFDYDIGVFKELSTIKEFLMDLDKKIESIYNLCDQRDYNFFIASLYGIYKTYIVGVDREVKLDYSKEVTPILVNKELTKTKYSFKYGTTFDLSNTIFSIITNNPNIPTSIKKKGFFSMFTD